jgi:hypothetical protein
MLPVDSYSRALVECAADDAAAARVVTRNGL